MTPVTEVEREILSVLADHDKVHKTFVRRHLDYQYDITITYTLLDAFLNGLEDENYVTTQPDSPRYAITARGEHACEGQATQQRVEPSTA